MTKVVDKFYILRDVLETERIACKFLINSWYHRYWTAIESGWNWQNHTLTHSSKIEKETEETYRYIMIMWQTGILRQRRDLREELKEYTVHHYEFTSYGLKWLKKTVYKKKKGEW